MVLCLRDFQVVDYLLSDRGSAVVNSKASLQCMFNRMCVDLQFSIATEHRESLQR